MHLRFFLWFNWLFMIVTFSGIVSSALPRIPDARLSQSTSLAISATQSGGSDGLFTKPSSTTQQYLLHQGHKSKRVNPLDRIKDVVAAEQGQQQKGWKERQQKIPPLSFLLFFPRKMAPSSSAEDPFLS